MQWHWIFFQQIIITGPILVHRIDMAHIQRNTLLKVKHFLELCLLFEVDLVFRYKAAMLAQEIK